MSTAIKFKRGTQAAVEAYSQSAEVGEPIFDIERKRLFIGTDTTIEEIGGDHFSAEDDTLDDINDGTTYGKVSNLDLTSNRVDFDKLSDGTTYGKVKNLDLTSNRIDLDKINDGTTYGKVKNLDLTSNRIDLDKLDGLNATKNDLNQLVDGEITIHGWQGITIADTTGSYDTFTITNSARDAIRITNAVGDAIRLIDAGDNAIEITNATTNAIRIDNSGDKAIKINNSADDAIYIEMSGGNSIHIVDSTALQSAIQIDDAGLYAINIDNSLDSAIHITTAGQHGIKIDNSTNNAIDIDDSGGSGVYINNSTNDAIRIHDSGDNAIEIDGCTTNGIQIEQAGGYGIFIDDIMGDDALHVRGSIGGHSIFVNDSTGGYGIYLGNCEHGDYGPLFIEASTGSGSAGLHTQYGNAAVSTLAVDSNNDLYIKTGASTWSLVGSSAASVGIVNSSTISGTASSNSAVIIDQDGLTMRDGSGNVRFDINEDGSWKLGDSTGANIDFSNSDVLTITNPQINEAVTLTATSTELNLLDGVSGLVQSDFTKLAAINASAADLNATTNFEETISATTSVVTIAASKDLNIAGHDLSSNGLKLNNVLVTSSAAELNLLDGVSGLVQSDFTKLAAIDASAAEIDRLNSSNGINITLANTSGHGIHIVDTNLGGNAILIDDTDEDAIRITTADEYGLYIGYAGLSGVRVQSTNNYGLYVANAVDAAIYCGTGCTKGIVIQGTDGGEAIQIVSADQEGILISDADHDAIRIVTAGDNAIEIDGATNNAIQIDGAGSDGIYISGAMTNHGIHIVTTNTSKHAIQIDDTGTFGNAINITDSAADAINIDYCSDNGLTISDCGGNAISILDAAAVGGEAILIGNSGGRAIRIATCAEQALHIGNSGANYAAIHIDDAGDHAIQIDSAVDDSHHGINMDITASGGTVSNGVYIKGASDNGIDARFCNYGVRSEYNTNHGFITGHNSGYGMWAGNSSILGPIHIQPTSSDPDTAYPSAAIGTLCVYSGKLYIATATGTFTIVGTQS